MAYTYHIYCKPTRQHYYGVRFAKNCHPSDLWVTYFTSSKKVKNLLGKYGIKAFDFEVRRVFESKEQAVNWEMKVLRRLDVLHKEEWLNSSTGMKHHALFPFSVETRKKMSIAHKNRTHRKGHKLSENTKQNMRNARADLVWISNIATGSTKFVHEHEVSSYIADGWVSGRFYFKHHTHTEESRHKMSASHRGIAQPKVSESRKGKVSCVDVHGNVLFIPKIEFDADHTLVGVASAEGKRRRSQTFISS